MEQAPKGNPEQYAAPAPLTPEQLAALPHDSQATKLLASIWTLAFVATVFLCMRIYCRLLKARRLWWDDGILIAAWVCIIIESSLLSYMTTLGYGRHIWDFDLRNMQPIMLPITVGGTFSVTAAVWSKTSFGITLLGITDGWTRKLTWFCIISMNVLMFLSALFPWIACRPVRKSWDLTVVGGRCWDPRVTVYYNIFSAAYSALMDMVLAMLPWKFLWSLQMKRSEKIGVCLAMSMGVFAGATAVVKTAKLPQMLSADFSDSVSLWIWGNAEVCCSIVAASIPMLRVLVRDAKSSRQYASGYHDRETGLTSNHSRFVSITSRHGPETSEVELHKLGDDRSDRSILGNDGLELQATKGIVQVTNITIKYDEETGGAQAQGPGVHRS